MKMFLVLQLLLASANALVASPSSKTYDATYTATVSGIPADAVRIKVWIPLPKTRSLQRISDLRVDSPYKWQRGHDREFNNDFLYATIDRPASGDLVVPISFRVTRSDAVLAAVPPAKATRAELQRGLQADRLVTLSPRIRKMADEITAGKQGTLEQAHAIYLYVLNNMTYDKTKPGYGKGDTERACDIKAGNCTDFHSLFMSLARAKGIPARFVIGFPLTAKENLTTGYHCWAEFYVEGKGWVPVDPSEASKSSDANVRTAFFGNLDADRLEFTIGRDLKLNPRTSEALNYFIYPRAETAGTEVGLPAIKLQWHEVDSSRASE
jgi:transglutaminase-like putative cysteine protease